MPGDPEQPLLSMQDLPGAVVLVVQHGRLSHTLHAQVMTHAEVVEVEGDRVSLLSQNLSQSPEM